MIESVEWARCRRLASTPSKPRDSRLAVAADDSMDDVVDEMKREKNESQVKRQKSVNGWLHFELMETAGRTCTYGNAKEPKRLLLLSACRRCRTRTAADAAIGHSAEEIAEKLFARTDCIHAYN